MSGSRINPITMYANTTDPLNFVDVFGLCKVLNDEIRTFISSKLKGMTWANIMIYDLGKGYESRTDISVEHVDAIGELDAIRQFYNMTVDLYECALTIEILNAIQEKCSTINMGLLERLQEQSRKWMTELRELAGDDQFKLRFILTLLTALETLGEYHKYGIARQLDVMADYDMVVGIWLDLKTRRVFVSYPNPSVEQPS